VRVRRLWIGIVILFASAGLAGCSEGGRLDRLSAGETGKVNSVESGDSFTLDNGLVVRLAGIETPWIDELGGPQAQADLSRLVQGRLVQLFYGGARRDGRGRALAQVRLVDSRQWVEGAMLSDGWARVRTFPDNRALDRPMLEDEARARIAKRGLWALSDYEVRLPQEIIPNLRGYQIVEGRVAAVTMTHQGVYLDFRADRRGFAALIDPHSVGDFAAAGIAPADLKGQLIRVRGMVGRDGPMRIDHPEPVELVKAR
jgi:endonuclease YncB( thermonuclease family)